MTPVRTAALLALSLAFALFACGSPATPVAPAVPSTAAPAPSAAASPAASTTPVGELTMVKEVNATGMGGAFDPATVTVKVGATVRFTNSSGNIHNVTFLDTSLKPSTVMSPSEVFEVTFPRAGTFKYRCTFHPGMDGTVVVA